MMKTISDIRLYRSREPNISGHSLPSEFAVKKLHIIASRIAMKLREAGFSMGDFDHLYINFTTCPVEGGSAPAKRELDTYHPWYRYYDVEVGEELYDTLGENADTVISLMEAVLCRYFATEEFGGEKIRSCINEAVTNGENMLMKYKEKKTKNRQAVLYLRLTDSGAYLPLLRVYDTGGNKLLEKDLPEVLTFDTLGEIRVSNSRVAVQPKKNCFAKDLEPIEFVF